MEIITRIAITFSRIVPPFYKKKLKTLMIYSGERKGNPEVITGITTIIALFLFGVSYFFYSLNFFNEKIIVAGAERKWVILALGAVAGFLAFFLVNFYYFLISTRRARFVEKILPDALFLIASNLKSGSTPFHAVKSSARQDFGPLAEAFEIAINKSLGTKAFGESIKEVGEEINSEVLKRSMKLFSTAIKSGSRISSLLEDLARDIISRQTLKKEMITNTRTNSMFIMFMVIVGAPFLMSVSIFFVNSIEGIQGTAGLTGETNIAGVGSFGGESEITPEFLTGYTYIFLLLTGFMASFFAATMVEGDGRNGIKRAPLIIGGAYISFFISQFIVGSLLGGVL